MGEESGALLVKDVLNELRAAIQKTREIMIAREPKNIVLDQVEVTLQTVLTYEGGIGVTFKVPFLDEENKAGGGVDFTDTRTHTHVVTLVPEDKEIFKLHGDEPKVEDALIQALLDTREIALSVGMGEHPFALHSSTFEVKFGVKRGGSIDVVLANMTYARETVQTIKLTLKNTDVPTPEA